MKNVKDSQILTKCHQLEKLSLSSQDRTLVKLVKHQLEDNWRKFLLDILDQLLEKYT